MTFKSFLSFDRSKDTRMDIQREVDEQADQISEMKTEMQRLGSALSTRTSYSQSTGDGADRCDNPSWLDDPEMVDKYNRDEMKDVAVQLYDGKVCETEDCYRPLDLFCNHCQLSLCYR